MHILGRTVLLWLGRHVDPLISKGFHLATVERAMGVLLVITGVAFLTGSVSTVSIWLLETFPSLQNLG